MAILPTNLARVSNLLRTGVATSSLARTQRMLLEVQNQLTTGQRLNVPSDDPGDGAIVQQLQKTLERRGAYLDNIKSAKDHLAHVDTSLDGLTGLLRQATQIASANVGSDVTAGQRESAAAVVENLYNQALSYGNTRHQGVYVFGGDRSNERPFETAANGGVKFVGSNDVLDNTFDDGAVLPFMVEAQQVFGATSDQRRGSSNASPRLTAATRLGDLAGATGQGVYKGLIQIANGGATATIDLTTADTVGDVITRINASAATTSVTASLAADGNSLLLTALPGTVAVSDVGGGTSARDLGILQSTPAATVDGPTVGARITPLTPLADLRGGLGIDPAGIVITNGLSTATVTLAGLTTVEDLVNRINASGTDVMAKINAAGTSIDILNPVQGTAMSIAENGGNTASHFGLRTMSGGSVLAELNGGKGVRTQPGADITITRGDGTSFSVDVDGAVTVNDVVARINTANGSTMAAYATTGNGIVLTDTAPGAGTFKVDAANYSSAALDLGLLASPSAAGVIVGADVNPVSSAGVFTNIARLRDALRASDATAITEAAEGLKQDLDRVARVRGVTGARVQELEGREDRITDENVATQSMLSNLQDVDYTSAISRYTTLQASLEASLKTTSQVTNLSLLDFIA